MKQTRRRTSRFSIFKYHDFTLLWIGQGISLIGTQMQLVGLNWHIYLLTKSAVALGLLGLARFLPIMVFGLLAGSFADTHNRKKLSMFAQISSTILSAILVVLTFGHMMQPIMIYGISILLAIFTSFDLPARQALLPNLVDRKDIARAVSLNSMMFYFSAITGPAIAGFVIGRFGVGSVYLVNTFSFLTVIAALLLMKNDGVVKGKIKATVSLGAILEGLRFVKSKTIIWSTMALDFFSTFFASASALLPIFAQTILKVGPIGLGFLYSAESVGALSASLFVAYKGKIKHQGQVLLLAIVFYAIGTILFGISRSFLFSFIGLFIVGAGDSVSAVIRNNIRQLTTPDYIRGRMTSITMIFFTGGPQLGEFESGILAAAVGAPLSVVIGGLGTLLVVGIMAATLPVLRSYQNTAD